MAITEAAVREHLIKAGVTNLKTFGYSNVTSKNILTDTVYKAFFVNMFKDEVNKTNDPMIEIARSALLKELGG